MNNILKKKLAEIWANRRAWLFESALPIWAEAGVDPTGGFYDSLREDYSPSPDEPKRFRVQARQIFVYAQAGRIGWPGPWKELVRHGLRFLRKHKRADGSYPSVYANNGASGVTLYDQAFALLALAHASDVLREPQIEREALSLLTYLHDRVPCPLGGFYEFAPSAARLQVNPNMHLFEAVLAWRTISDAPQWAQTAGELRNLARSVFIDPKTQRLREFFDENGNARSDQPTDVEPGHQFEWASLFLIDDSNMLPVAEDLIRDASWTGVDRRREVAINALRIDGTSEDSGACLWAQTERLRATLLLAPHTASDHWLNEALKCEQSLRRYLDSPSKGLWQDCMRGDRLFPLEPTKASSLYHLVNAYLALKDAV